MRIIIIAVKPARRTLYRKHENSGEGQGNWHLSLTERTRIANLRCEDVVAIGRAPYTNWIGRMQPQDREIVMRSLSSVGMEAYARPHDG